MKTGLQKEELDTILSEATIDCYGLTEEFYGLLTYLQDELIFPFDISLLGLRLEVIALTDRHVLPKLVVTRDGTKYPIDLTDVEVIDKKSRNYLLIETFKRWLMTIF